MTASRLALLALVVAISVAALLGVRAVVAPAPAAVTPDDRLGSLVDTRTAIAVAEPPPPGPPMPGSAGSPVISLEVRPFSEFSPTANDFLENRQPQWGAALLLPGEGIAYEANGRQQFPLASLTKVAILAAFLDDVAVADRELTRFEDELLWAMVAASDNEAANLAWDWIGGAEGLGEFLHRKQVPGITPAVSGLSWGDTTGSALGVGQLLARLGSGDLLGEAHRDYALQLLTSVDPQQRWGAPLAFGAEATVAMKNGWYPAITGWRVASAAVLLGEEPAILVVLTRNQPEMEYGIATIEGFAELVAEARSGTEPAARVSVQTGETLQSLFQPAAEGLPEVEGECVPSATVRRTGAWSCVIDGTAFDRCFTSSSSALRAVCDSRPGRAGTFAVVLPEDLVAGVFRPERASPWLLVLDGGLVCTAIRGAPANEDGDRVTYECDDGTLLLGPVQRTTIFYVLQAEAAGLWLQTVAVESAWF